MMAAEPVARVLRFMEELQRFLKRACGATRFT
jgi:hypothetical protein